MTVLFFTNMEPILNLLDVRAYVGAEYIWIYQSLGSAHNLNTGVEYRS
jgi:hypothetical protein